ncbi:MAG TPA: DUF488 domain-containing protein [Phenylobacterium sp.]|nr:DUF488 domain-containing protein [Phenylobacterium sp.]
MGYGFRIKRVYEPPLDGDGLRVLVDRLWPRGLSKAAARVDLWIREIAPSDELRTWFDHQPGRWDEFRRRYRDELRDNPVLGRLQAFCRGRPVTLLFAAQDPDRNNAVVLADLLTAAPAAPPRPGE